MRYTKLKKADINLSVIGMGTNAVGGHNLYSNIDEKDSIRLVEKALDLGINYFDTADAYGIGRSEELLGQVIKKSAKRQEMVIASKGAIEFLTDGTSRMNNKPKYLREALEKSLQRLDTDYIDIYYIHWPDNETPIEEAVGEMKRLQEEGKIRAVGLSNFNLEDTKKAEAIVDIAMVQLPYNMLDQKAGKELLPYCVESGTSFTPYGPLAYGILGGKYNEGFQLDTKDWRNSSPLFHKDAFSKHMKVVKRLKEIAGEKNVSTGNIALGWLLAQAGIDAIIPGAKRIEQIEDNVKAADIFLSTDELAYIDELLD